MSIDALFAVSRFGLNFERLRIEAAARNLALSNTTQTAGDPVQPLQVTATAIPGQSSFASILDPAAGEPQLPVIAVQESPAAPRVVHDPSSPLADKNGDVRYPNVDPAAQMTTLVDAERAYQANVRALNTLQAMVLKTLQIGGR